MKTEDLVSILTGAKEFGHMLEACYLEYALGIIDGLLDQLEIAQKEIDKLNEFKCLAGGITDVPVQDPESSR